MARSALAELRDLVPLRPLTISESLRIAELQANRLLRRFELTAPPVEEQLISELPRIEVRRLAPMIASGAAKWVDHRWVIVLNGNEASTRQRFSLAHEFKHIVDHPFRKLIYPGFKEMSAADRAEQVADYFAAALLMPKTWVKHAWAMEGLQDLKRLALRFGVSQQAMDYRLRQLGLVEQRSRCAPYQRTDGEPADAEVLAELFAGLRDAA